MTFDDGILKIYTLKNIALPGKKPIQGLQLKSRHYFGFETVGINRFYTAMQVDSRVTDLVHIWQDRSITTGDICVLEDGMQYCCSFVQHTEDENGLRITKITLERLGEAYDIIKN